ncbi:uncharacterized protein SCHCODRAFT_02354563 [Schizophyllum commune H4-8]|uniref:uncharacterized protein n=1 Tax=Schizophyllum commune (strain H4-8 / FGSC 9210) TaxID=578458 RepID=UPI00215FEE3D|nr:uncharacterized protein SCHCODRAFT_02354563 [Schizophyllum commune H4-8]KAI5890823.1 hypothetical protein SCHCODRAFT_02354563 [Schizophyllum commune H4-8]
MLELCNERAAIQWKDMEWGRAPAGCPAIPRQMPPGPPGVISMNSSIGYYTSCRRRSDVPDYSTKLCLLM